MTTHSCPLASDISMAAATSTIPDHELWKILLVTRWNEGSNSHKKPRIRKQTRCWNQNNEDTRPHVNFAIRNEHLSFGCDFLPTPLLSTLLYPTAIRFFLLKTPSTPPPSKRFDSLNDIKTTSIGFIAENDKYFWKKTL